MAKLLWQWILAFVQFLQRPILVTCASDINLLLLAVGGLA